jgi:hypothetical protein
MDDPKGYDDARALSDSATGPKRSKLLTYAEGIDAYQVTD